jgi:hypothetical protein
MKTKGMRRGKMSRSKTVRSKRNQNGKYFLDYNANDRIRKNNTLTKGKDSFSNFEREITIVFITFLNVIKLYHWNTYSFGEHKATDNLYEQMNAHIDKFMEVLLGKEVALHPTSGRLDIDNLNIKIPSIYNREQLAEYIQVIKSYLITIGEKDELEVIYNDDLYNIRDEIVADLNNFLYLLTLE